MFAVGLFVAVMVTVASALGLFLVCVVVNALR